MDGFTIECTLCDYCPFHTSSAVFCEKWKCEMAQGKVYADYEAGEVDEMRMSVELLRIRDSFADKIAKQFATLLPAPPSVVCCP